MKPGPERQGPLDRLHDPAGKQNTGGKPAGSHIAVDNLERADGNHGNRHHLGEQHAAVEGDIIGHGHLVVGKGDTGLQTVVSAQEKFFQTKAFERVDTGQGFNNKIITDFTAEILLSHLQPQFITDKPGQQAEGKKEPQGHKNKVAGNVPDQKEKYKDEGKIDNGEQGLAGIKAAQAADGGHFLQIRSRALFFKTLHGRLEDMFHGPAGGFMLKDGTGPGCQVRSGDTQEHFQNHGSDNSEDKQGKGPVTVAGQDAVIGLQHHDRHGQCQQVDDQRRENQMDKVYPKFMVYGRLGLVRHKQ